MLNKDCAIARDLMPAVIDAIASEPSRAYVEEHTAACEPCAQVYADMQAEIQALEAGKAAEADPSFKIAVAQLRRTMGWKRLKTIVLAAVLTMILLIAGYGGYYYLCEYSAYVGARALPLDAYTVSVYQGSDGTAYGTTAFQKYYNTNGPMLTDTDGGILYMYWSAPIILVEKERVPYPNPQYGVHMSITADGALAFGDTLIAEIRQGTPDDYIVVYRSGDPIPALDPIVDQYFQMEESYFSQQMEVQQARQDAYMEYHEYIDQQDSDESSAPAAAPEN